MASKREKIKLKSSKSAFFYYTTKNKTKTPDRITLKKFDPTIREHCEFKETK
jgi:large subunit ribosomal protein L33